MRIAVISDLHLGSNPQTDAFGHDDWEFIRFLKYLESEFQSVILLGDIWETLTTATPGRQREELLDAQSMHREIHQRLLRPCYTYIHGNHDWVAKTQQQALEEYAIETDDQRLLFSHGHQGDALCSTGRILTEIGVWIGAWIRRFGFHVVYAYFTHLEGSRNQDPLSCAVRAWALEEAKRRAVDIVVTGHTHRPARNEDGSTLFLNSGTCSNGKISFLSLDTKRGDFQVNAGF